MKTWLKRLTLTALLIASFMSVSIGGYLLGWKTGPRPNLSALSQTDAVPHGAANAQRRGSDARSAPLLSQQGLLASSANPDAGLTNLLRQAWSTLRFNPDADLAAAEVWHLLESFESGQLAVAFDAACALPGGPTRDQVVRFVLQHWARRDPGAAFAALAKQFPHWDRFNFMTPVIGQVAPRDPNAAYRAYRDYLAALDSPSHDSAVFPLTYIFSSWARHDFDGAWLEFQALNDREKTYAMRGITQLLQDDSEAGRRLLAILNDPSIDSTLLNEARREVVRNLARRPAPDTALEWLQRQSIPAESRRSLEEELAWSWAESNPRAAADWLLAQSVPAEQGERLRRVIDRWANWEPTAAAEWLNELRAQGIPADAAVDAFVRSISMRDPASALTWAAAISDPDARRQTVAHLGERFRRAAVSGAATLIENSTLSAADQHAALDRLKGL